MTEPPGTRRSPGQPPRATATSDLQADQANEHSIPFDAGIPAALKRRREASWRLPVLPSGYRDPFDERARDWPRDVDACRAAWAHLNDLGLMSELVDKVLKELAGAA